jgi:hypothetical protein
MKTTWSVLLGLLLAAAPAAMQAQYGYSTNTDGSIYTYSTNADGSINFAGYAGPPWAVTIPTNINGLTVTTIGHGAFNGLTIGLSNLTSVTIPGTITSIGEDAFEYCFGLTNVTIPDSVTSIADHAFAGAGLTCVFIPGSVTNIGLYALYGDSLRAITVDSQNPVYSSVAGVVFDKSGYTLLQYPHGGIGSYTIPGGVTNVGLEAFFGCVGLTSVTIPGSVASIGGGAFALCYGLTNVAMASGVATIENGAFNECTNLTGITIPGSVAYIGWSAFASTGLTNVTIPGSVTNLGDYAFGLCYSLAGVHFLGNAPFADTNVFDSDTNATVYYLPGTTGWSNTFAGLPTALWVLPNPLILNSGSSLGAQSNAFGFTISWATNISVVVEACTNLASPVWTPLQTNALNNGAFHFSEALQTNIPGRYYRIRSP